MEIKLASRKLASLRFYFFYCCVFVQDEICELHVFLIPIFVCFKYNRQFLRHAARYRQLRVYGEERRLLWGNFRGFRGSPPSQSG
jgi:hypothetical protein